MSILLCPCGLKCHGPIEDEVGAMGQRLLSEMLGTALKVRHRLLSAGPCCSTRISSHAFSVRLSRGSRVTPGIASLNPGLMSSQPFRAAGLHAGGVKEISPR